MPALCRSSNLRLFTPSEGVRALAGRLGCSLLTAAVLESRENSSVSGGFCEDPSWEAILDRVELGRAGEEASRKWRDAGNLGKVLVYGDYDVDGVSSTVLALELCRGRSEQARFFIPHRHEQGYGLHGSVLRRLLPLGWDTLVVVDCGSKDGKLIAEAEEAGVRVFVFDHHLPEAGQPLHPSVVNPHGGQGCTAGRSLCATGVLWAWAWKFGILPKNVLEEMTDLVALATLADCMPLTPLNRGLVRKGMGVLARFPRPGLEKLFSRLGVSRESINEESLTMKVIPCLNAAGRMDLADTAVHLLLGGSGADENAESLLSLNRKRQAIAGRISEEASFMLNGPCSHVALGESWPVGVLSSVASRLCSQKGSPVVLAAPVNGYIRGTLRVPEGGDAMKILDPISESLDAWGGHQYAAGFSVSRPNWEPVCRYLENALGAMEVTEPLVTAISLRPEEILLEDWKETGRLGPFGHGNPAPLFYIPRIGDEKVLLLGKGGRHLQVASGSSRLLVFDGQKQRGLLESSAGFVFRPRIDSWRGEERLQYVVDYVVT